jgi:hypothetical protein
MINHFGNGRFKDGKKEEKKEKDNDQCIMRGRASCVLCGECHMKEEG